MKRLILVVILTLAVLATIPLLLEDDDPFSYQGWIEADSLLIGSDTIGRLVDIDAREGSTVTKGEVLFRLDTSNEEAALAAANAAVAGTVAELDLAQAAQKRPEEIDMLRASQREAEARLELSVQSLERTKALVRQGTGTRANLDTAIATEAASRAALDSIQSQIALATLPAREQEIRRAREALQQARAELRSTKAELAKRTIVAPTDGTIQTIYYRSGEIVPVARPVVALLPPENIRVRFFVPESAIADLSLNQMIHVTCNGCEPFDARISFISSEAAFTPPVIFSTQERSRLVYRIEAIPEDPQRLRPGQPVDVVPGAFS